MSKETIVAQGSVYCSVLGGNVEIIVVEREGIFGTSTHKRCLCPHKFDDNPAYCTKTDAEGRSVNESCGIANSLR